MPRQTKGTLAGRPSGARRGRGKPAAHEAAGGGQDSKRGSVRVYRHGLGDCMLVRIRRRGMADFKLLIDCGVVTGSGSEALRDAVEDVIKETDGALDAIAVTHEHWDHVSGFVQAEESFAKLKGKVGEVWLGWTEDEGDALARTVKDEMGKAVEALKKSALRFGASSSTSALLEEIAVMGSFGAAGQTTAAALEKARSLAKIRYWRPSEAPYEIKGAHARVYALGPPRDIKKIRKINPSKRAPETYGLAMNGDGAIPLGLVKALDEPEGGRIKGAPFHPRVSIPQKEAEAIAFFADNYFQSPDEWRRIDDDWLGPTTDFALALQSYTNNTSLVLAIELGAPGEGDVLLFAADAQVGNWLSWPDCAWPETTGDALVRRTIFYKVGHHGSHNATLKSEGLEKMAALQTAVIPVDGEMAQKKHWGRMPLPDLVEALEKRAKGGVFRTDESPVQESERVTVTEEYIEYHF